MLKLLTGTIGPFVGMALITGVQAAPPLGHYQLKAMHSGRCVEIQNGSRNNGAAIIQSNCARNDHQLVQFGDLGNGYVQIQAKHSGKCLDVAYASQSDGATVQQWSCSGASHQQWRAIKNSNGSYTFLARHSGRALDVQGASTQNGALLFQWRANGKSNQQYQLLPAGSQPPVETPLIPLPGRLEAEDYTSYFDTTAGNEGHVYRSDNVDIEVTVDSGGGHNIGWVDAGEYLRYRVQVEQAGRYKITARTSTPQNARSFRLKLKGNEIARFNPPNSNDWQNWRNVTAYAQLSAGQHELEIYFDAGLLNLNYLDFEKVDDDTGGTDPGTPGNGWTLVWSDEFNGNSIDASKWEHEVNAKGGGNNELQYYTARRENSYVSNGSLKLVARKERYTSAEGTRDYTSARLRTRNKGDWKYGRIEVSARLPYGQGLWPAIWMLPTDNIYGSWAASGEIDIMEAVNLRGRGGNRVHGTLHYGGQWPDNTHSGKPCDSPRSVVDHFHVYTVEWEPEEIRWYVDGKLYQTQREWWTGNANARFPAPFDQRFHLLLNVAVGGNWPGNPDASSTFPQTMEVDYVRVYQKSDGNPPAAGAAIGIMSFNVRTEQANDPGERSWSSRRGEVVRAIQTRSPTVIGLQEATGAQYDYIKGALGANWSSSPRRRTLYRQDLFVVQRSGVIDLVADQWGHRSAEWIILQRRADNKRFVFLNNHWGVDNASQQGSANILRDRLGEINENWALPTVLLGDLNATPSSTPITTLLNNTRLTSQISGGTFNDWSPLSSRQLDYIMSHQFSASGCLIVTYMEGSYPPSDHFPVYCSMQFR